MPNPNCVRCGNKLSKPRLAANKRKCYRCEVAARRERKWRAHDRSIESEDFTAEDYWHLYECQGGTCAVYTCRANGTSKHLTVEHDHQCTMGHDPKRWCRVCVRGLTCSMHNEWIARTGDNPEIFDSLAAYLRVPPARSAMMERMTVGNEIETIKTLMDEYRIPGKRAQLMTNMARSVGPSPTHLPKSTIVIRYIRVPRTTKELFEIVETNLWLDSMAALKQLVNEQRMPEDMAKRALNRAWEHGKHRMKGLNGSYLIIHYRGRGPQESYMFSFEETQ